MQISVVIPSYNRLPSLVRAITSVVEQSSPVDEIIVVDDGSGDNTATKIPQLFPQVRLLIQKNSGVSAARNLGIKNTSYDWIALLDSDDSWMQNKIETIRLSHQQQPEYNLFHSDEIWIRDGIRVNSMHKHRKSGGWIFQQCLPLCVISPSAVVLRRQMLEPIGNFDESLPVCEDYDLWLRICHRYPVCYIDKPLITKYGGHDDQLSRRHWGMDRFRIRALQNLLDNCQLNNQDRLATQAMIEKKLRILLKGAYKHDNQTVIAEFEPMLERALPL